jgi:hypothetical protein
MTNQGCKKRGATSRGNDWVGEGTPAKDVIAIIQQWDRHYPQPAARAINELIRRYMAVSGVVQFAVEQLERQNAGEDTSLDSLHGPVEKANGPLAKEMH